MKQDIHWLLIKWGRKRGAVEGKMLERLQGFAEFLSQYDGANVIGTKDLDEIVGEHIVDSLSCTTVPDFSTAKKVVDVGSGAGLPGIPLAILHPRLAFTLVDSVGKKTAFQREAVAEAALENVEMVQMRLEEVGRSRAHREKYDIATSRALASLDVVAEYCLPLLKVGGVAVAMKGRLDEAEVKRGRAALERLGGVIRSVHVLERLDDLVFKERSLVVIEKVRKTPGEYPRQTGVPKKNPLGGE